MKRSAEIRVAKLVIAGAPGCGKLKILRSVAMRYGADLPDDPDLGGGRAASCRFEVDSRRYLLCCLTGTQDYAAAEELLLRDAAGILFVMDVEPRRLKAGWDALVRCSGTLKQAGFDLQTMPFVMQYHRSDQHPGFDPDRLDAQLMIPSGSVPRFVTPERLPDARNGAVDSLIAAVSSRADTE